LSHDPGAQVWLSLPPEPAPLGAGCVHVFRAWLHVPESAAALDDRLPLDLEERERMARYHRPADRTRFGLARAFLRRTLGRYLRIPAESVALVVQPDGKPEVRGIGAPSSLCFNLSHSGDLALIAVSGTQQVGIDVELIRELPRLDGLIKRCLTREEQVSQNGLTGEQRLLGFFRLWTRKEAILKGLGSGLSRDPARTSVLRPEHPEFLPGESDASVPSLSGWSIRDLSPAEGYVGALAVQGHVDEIQFFDDPGPAV
jgi:4'-phosphopantetheinyl transferase